MKPIIAIPATLALCYRAWKHQSLTPAGIAAAAVTAMSHAMHPWSMPFALLVVFYLAGSRATKVKAHVKETLTMKAGGSSGAEGPRTHIQVLANSVVASVLTLLHAYQLHRRSLAGADVDCYPWAGDLLLVGIIANYAAVSADTFSSELGILSNSQPRLITSLTLRKVPRGTNGGVTAWGLLAGLFGSLLIVTTALVLTPLCVPNTVLQHQWPTARGWQLSDKQWFAYGMTLWGLLGSVVDSVLGGLLQHSVIDARSGRVVEGDGGQRVLASTDSDGHEVSKSVRARTSATRSSTSASPKHAVKPSFGADHPSRVVEAGLDILDNNQVNFLMALIMSVGAMAVASWVWEVPLSSILSA